MFLGIDLAFVRGARRTISVKSLEKLAGIINHISDALWQRRALVQTSYLVLHWQIGERKDTRWRRLSTELKQDWRHLYALLAQKQLVPLMQVSLSLYLPTDHDALETDASLDGCGAVFRSFWFAAAWPPALRRIDIQILEAVTVVLALSTWEEWLRRHTSYLRLWIDNQSVVYSLRKSGSAQPMVRSLVKWCATGWPTNI